MKNKYYQILTYGCQMNENDSEKLAGILTNMGYSSTNDENKADLIILNTCSVRENADVRVLGHLGQYKHLKRKNPNLILCVCGCMMQQESIVNEIKKKYKQVDIIFGTHNLHKFPQLLSNYIQNQNFIVDVWDEGKEIVEDIPIERKYPYKAFVSIMYGCNNFCSYCIVPYTRGRERSREPDKIVKEVRDLAISGCKEVTLLGQNVNSYGKTLDKPISFSKLLKELCSVEGLERIRFMTSHPKDISTELIETIRDNDKICNHIHLPFQSGSTRILKIMNRKYTKEKYIELIQGVKQEIPNISVTTDIIVGFPGETEEDFNDTLDVLKICEFDSSFTFIYSIRTGTPASQMENQIPDEIKHDRLQRLLNVQHEISANINSKMQDKIVKVLVEGPSKNDESMLAGRTDSNKLVNFKGDFNSIGQIVEVKITKPQTFSLYGIQI